MLPSRRPCGAEDRSESIQPEESLNVEEGSLSGITPDATDGVGTIEFTSGETWAYFGTTTTYSSAVSELPVSLTNLC